MVDLCYCAQNLHRLKYLFNRRTIQQLVHEHDVTKNFYFIQKNRYCYTHVVTFKFSMTVQRNLIIQFLKRIIFKDQLRTSKIFQDLIQDGSWNTIEGLNLYEKFSFPSGHTALIFCFCITLSLYIKKNNWALFFISIAFLVGFSRIYLTQHFLIDVLFGALIGSLIALLMHTYLGKLISKISFIKNKNEKG